MSKGARDVLVIVQVASTLELIHMNIRISTIRLSGYKNYVDANNIVHTGDTYIMKYLIRFFSS